jgi:DNA-directed RNA polymerase specialized sigma24 family protein
VRSEDEAEFAGLVQRQWRFACRVAWAVSRQAQDAEDAAQEAFLKIVPNRQSTSSCLRRISSSIGTVAACRSIDETPRSTFPVLFPRRFTDSL